MVVVSVTPPAVATKIVQFTGDQGVGPAIVLDGVEDRNPVDRQRDGAAEQGGLGGNRVGCLFGEKRNTPGVFAGVGLGDGYMLLSGTDSHHQLMNGMAVARDRQASSLLPQSRSFTAWLQTPAVASGFLL